VKLGERSADRVEILSGIEAGTEVAVTTVDQLVDGQRVSVAPGGE